MNNNISIDAFVGADNIKSDISTNELAKSINNEHKRYHTIDDIIEIQNKNKKQKNVKYEHMYRDVLNLIYEHSKLQHTYMIYTMPYTTDINDYDYNEFKNYLIQKLNKNNIAIAQYKKYNGNAFDNQYIITWRFISCKK